MDQILQSFLSPSVLIYILGVLAVPFITPHYTRLRARKVVQRRKEAGLGDQIISNPGEGLAKRRKDSLIETAIVLGVVVLLPLFIIGVMHLLPIKESRLDEETGKLKIAFGAFILWALVSGTSVAKNFLGGLAFRSLSAFSDAIQPGDRVTVSGHHGIVKEIGIFYTKLQTMEDDQVAIPSAQLLDAVVLSTNAGQRSSMVCLSFYLHSSSNADQTQGAENIIWDTIQSAMLFDCAHPLKIFLAQTPNSIILTAKCYVTSTYAEAEFRSEVTKQVLAAFSKEGYLLGNPGT